MDDTFVITIRISGLSYKLRIPRKDEIIYRRAAELLNRRIDHYRDKFTVSNVDILTMVAFEFAVEHQRIQNQYHSAPASVIDNLSSLLSDALNDDDLGDLTDGK